MSGEGERSKLVELQRKTDRQLRAVVSDDLERGLRLARVGAPPDRLRAGQAYSEAQLLLPKIYDLTTAEQSRFQSLLTELGRALEEPGRTNVL